MMESWALRAVWGALVGTSPQTAQTPWNTRQSNVSATNHTRSVWPPWDTDFSRADRFGYVCPLGALISPIL